ncbi:MAG: fatty acid desaturase [Saprospiraceae bacterium]|nr:fatty acid desaturase [Saprospiraceae bacterium]
MIQHDCGHKSFFKSRKLNNVVGFVCSFFSTIPYKYWARTHSFHHAHTGQLEHRDIGDIDFLTVEEFRKKSKFERFRYKLFRTPINLFFILPIMYLLIAIRFPFINMNGWKLTRKSQVVNNIAILIGYGILAYFIGLQSLLLIQGPIVVMFGVIAFWFFYVQHQHERTYMQWSENWEYLFSAIKGSTYYKLPKIFQWFTGNIGFHHIHHLSTLIPNYNLETCAKENPILQQYVRILTFRESLKCMFLKLWDEEQQRMITFREYKILEQARLQPIKMEVLQNRHHNQLN